MKQEAKKPLIAFPPGTLQARFLRREKRFRVEVETPGDGPVWVHCNNSGSMLGALPRPGGRVIISPASNPKRRLPYTLEIVHAGGVWVGVNTLSPNRMLYQAWLSGLIPEMRTYTEFNKERKIGDSRIDAMLEGPSGRLWIEAKNVTLVEYDTAYFPDAATERGRKHLKEMIDIVGNGDRAAFFYLIQRADAECFCPADFVDPQYAELFYEALDAGVEAWPYRALVSPEGIGLDRRLPVVGAGSPDPRRSVSDDDGDGDGGEKDTGTARKGAVRNTSTAPSKSTGPEDNTA